MRDKRVKVSEALLVAGLVLTAGVGASAEDHPDAFFYEDDAKWSHDMARRHQEAIKRTGKEVDAYLSWAESTRSGELPSYWWSRLSNVYRRELDLLQKDIDDTRRRFAGRNPECIRALDEFEHGGFAKVRAEYAEYAREKPMHEWFGGAPSVYAHFPNVTCLTRHDNVRRATEELRRARMQNR